VRGIVIAILLFLSGFTCSAGETPVTVQMEYSPGKITVGDPVQFKFIVESPAGISVSAPISASVFGEWEVLGVKPFTEKPVKGGGVRREFEWAMTAWTTGKVTLPSPRFTFTGTGGRPGYASASPGLMEVESVLARDKNPADLKPPKGLIGYRNIWPYIWAALAVLGISFLIWWWQRRKKRLALIASGIIPGVPVKPAEDIAREALEELAASGLAETAVKIFYVRLSDILRRYIEGKFGIPAMDRTTAELLPEIRRHSVMRDLNAEFRIFFEDCDLAKFAKYVPSQDDIATDLARARRVVDETATTSPVVSDRTRVEH